MNHVGNTHPRRSLVLNASSTAPKSLDDLSAAKQLGVVRLEVPLGPPKTAASGGSRSPELTPNQRGQALIMSMQELAKRLRGDLSKQSNKELSETGKKLADAALGVQSLLDREPSSGAVYSQNLKTLQEALAKVAPLAASSAKSVEATRASIAELARASNARPMHQARLDAVDALVRASEAVQQLPALLEVRAKAAVDTHEVSSPEAPLTLKPVRRVELSLPKTAPDVESRKQTFQTIARAMRDVAEAVGAETAQIDERAASSLRSAGERWVNQAASEAASIAQYLSRRDVERTVDGVALSFSAADAPEGSAAPKLALMESAKELDASAKALRASLDAALDRWVDGAVYLTVGERDDVSAKAKAAIAADKTYRAALTAYQSERDQEIEALIQRTLAAGPR